MTTLSKDEVVKMAREAGFIIGRSVTTGEPNSPERFATLCRAPLVAEVERLEQWHAEMADNRNAIASERDTLKAELARVRAGEPFGWYSAKEDDFMLDKIRKTHERLNSHTHRIGKYDTALFTAPQPAAQELDCATTGVCVRSGLYASPPSAVPVVEQLVEALKSADGRHALVCHLHAFGNKCTCGLDEKTTAALAAGQQYLKENGK